MRGSIQRLLAKFGYSLRRINNYSSPSSDQVLKSIFGKDDKIVIFDVGAHKGESAKKYRGFFDNAEIYSFEPFEQSFEVLKNIGISQFKPLNFGLSDRKSLEKFCINNGSPTNSLLALSENAKDVWGGNEGLNQVETIECHFMTFDDFCNDNAIQYVDFMKVDVQGAEFKVLKGAHKALSEKRIKILQIEVIIGNTYEGQKSLAYYVELLEGYGYKLKIFSDFAVVNGNLVQTDLFFTSV